MRGMKKWLPFKSLKGQYDVIEEVKREKRKVSRPELSSDQEEEIDSVLSCLRKGDKTFVTFFYNGEIIEKKDVFLELDPLSRKVRFLGFALAFGDILSLRIL